MSYDERKLSRALSRDSTRRAKASEREARKRSPKYRAEDLPPKQRDAFERVSAHLLAHPGTPEREACRVVHVTYTTWCIARDRIRAYEKGIADDVEAFEFDRSKPALKGIG